MSSESRGFSPRLKDLLLKNEPRRPRRAAFLSWRAITQVTGFRITNKIQLTRVAGISFTRASSLELIVGALSTRWSPSRPLRRRTRIERRSDCLFPRLLAILKRTDSASSGNTARRTIAHRSSRANHMGRALYILHLVRACFG